MDTQPSPSKPHPSHLIDRPVAVTRVADNHWHALDDDVVVGRGHAQKRPDGRLFVSIDAWYDATFDRIAEAMVTDLPAPLHTVVDDADVDLTASWLRAGFRIRRREWEFSVPTDPLITGLGQARPPSDVTIVPAGQADAELLRAVDRAIRNEVEAEVGWHAMPAEVIAMPGGDTIGDGSKYAAAVGPHGYLGLIRVVTVIRPRIGLVAVRAGERRRGIARALLAHALGTLHDVGHDVAWAEVQESNRAASALFKGIGARPMSSNLELVR